ncbi:hypothetical protein, partial [Candidatus Avelusimicrobium fimicolum]|uniref:hypothetical protein n=1 Tax=Candidatus Avelusimicrobium fimicolum TaxID=3416216 RepID=UPI003D103BBC
YDETSNTCRTVQGCSDATYKASHKKECCPSAPKTDTVCYKLQWGSCHTNSAGNDPSCEERNDYYNDCDQKSCSVVGERCEWMGCGGGIYEDGECLCELSKNGW